MTLKNNPVAKHFWKSSRAKTEPNKRSKLLDDAEHRESLEYVLEAEIDGKYEDNEEEE